MARAHFRDIAVGKDPTTGFLKTIDNPTVTLYESGTSTPLGQTIYANPTGIIQLPNPSVGGADGTIEFWLDVAQIFRIVVAGTGFGALTLDYEDMAFDPSGVLYQNVNAAVHFEGYPGISDYALTVQATAGGATGNKIFSAQTNTNQAIVDIAALGSGPSASLVAHYHNPTVGPMVISDLRNWDSSADLFVVIHRTAGLPVGTHVPAQFTYHSSAKPSDGTGGNVNVPDEVVANFDAFAENIASGASQNYDGSMRAIEIQTLVFANTGQRTMAAMTAGCHTAVTKFTNVDNALAGGGTITQIYGDCGIIIHNNTQGYPGFGTTVRANTGLLIWGNPGWKQGLAYLNPANALLWAVDQFGDSYSGNMFPRPGGSFQIGSVARLWTAGFIGTVNIQNGAAANPTMAIVGSGFYNDGLFGVAGGGVVGIGTGATEAARFDNNGFGLARGQRFTGVIGPFSLTAQTDNWNPAGLSSARIIRVQATTNIILSGIVAQAGGVYTIINIGVPTITLPHEHAGSTVNNRFNFGNSVNVVLNVHDSVTIWYDIGGPRWKRL